MLASPQAINGNPNSDIMRFYQRRPFFVFAYEGTINNDTLMEILSEEERSESVKLCQHWTPYVSSTRASP